ncbi:MAG: polyphosphate polymerase domain-containing protein [Bacteroidales bacterium]|nr:polyphosphate polymerase domain-containing protein [Bacteroidales bacterium]
MLRYEYKYIVPKGLLNKLRKSIVPYMDVDKFAKGRKGNDYTVKSIYFDSPAFDFYFEKVEGIKNRKKVRLRAYNLEDPENSVFLEIKRKFNIPILKHRSITKFKHAKEIFSDNRINGYIVNSKQFPELEDNSKRFFYQIFSKKLKPVILIIYEREPYLYKFDDSIRITFDKNLRSIPYPAIDELYLDEKAKSVLQNSFIMEVKFNDTFPAWMTPVIGKFNLRKQAASKYTMCLDSQNIVKKINKPDFFINSKW